MGRNLKLELNTEQREELQKTYRTDKSYAVRQRSLMVLMKAEKKPTKEICKIVGIDSENQINSWIKRYQIGYATQGISVLHNKAGQGRKATFDKDKDKARVREAVKKERQRLSQAKLILEQELDKTFHLKTLKRFLKNLSADISASENQ